MLEEKRNNKPDVVLKKYWENKERFSDFFNAVLFDGKTVIRPEELIVGSTTIAPRGCQTYPEFSYEWLEAEFETVETRSADPFYISDETKKRLYARA